jgi:heme exporter protein A
VTLQRGERVLVRELSFSAEPGAFVEIRGANGAGKTTLLRAIAGFLAPRAGRIVYETVEEPTLALHHVGHLNGLKRAASVRAHVRYWAGLFGVGVRVDETLERLGLARQADLPARVLSQGQARRLALTRLVIAPRPIWLLDEPAASLDAEGRALLSEMIASHRAQGGLVLAAVHEALGVEPSLTLTMGAT